MTLLHDTPLFRIYFGNSSDNLHPSMYLENQLMPTNEHIGQTRTKNNKNITDTDLFTHIKKAACAKDLFFLHQTHSALGYTVTPVIVANNRPFTLQGDFLTTNNPAIGTGIMTADCLPIIIYDVAHNAIGIAHAGWRGSMQNIAVTMIKHMQQEYATPLENLLIFFGPSAKACCYAVDYDFKKNIENYLFFNRTLNTHSVNQTKYDVDPTLINQTLKEHNKKFFFDLPLFNRLQLEAIGIKQSCFNETYNICTICDLRYSSYRRDGAQAGRNATVICLK